MINFDDITKKWNKIKIQHNMNTIFVNSENSKTSDPHGILLNLSDTVALSNLAYTITGKI